MNWHDLANSGDPLQRQKPSQIATPNMQQATRPPQMGPQPQQFPFPLRGGGAAQRPMLPKLMGEQ